MKTTKIYTVRDAMREAILVESDTRHRTTSIEYRNPIDARIGVLCRKGKPVYYAVIDGIYRESMDLAAIESDLASI
jgi:hypothetical protein